MEMDYRFLGETGIRVSVIGLGTMTFGSNGSFAEMVGGVGIDEASRMVDYAVERGVNHIDTANAYARGEAEEFLGRILGTRRSDLILATKVHARMTDQLNDRGQSRKHVIQSVDASLRRLRTEYIDLLYLHGVDEFVDWEIVLRTLNLLISRGKVLHFGLSNFSAWQVMKIQGLARQLGIEGPVAVQAHYSLIDREAELELIPMCQDQRFGFVAWGPLSNGILTAKYRDPSGPTERRRIDRLEHDMPIDSKRVDRVIGALTAISSQSGSSPAAIALQYLISRVEVASILVGARSLAQLEENLDGALAARMEIEAASRLDDASEYPIPYPQWHQLRYSRRLKERDYRNPAAERYLLAGM